jgi:hypothetical protein
MKTKAHKQQAAAPTLRGEVLWGARAIADEIGIDVRACYYLLQCERLPAKKIGDVWVTTRSRLRRAIEGEAA